MERPDSSRVELSTAGAHPHKAPLGLRSVAVFELIKGLLFLVFAIGALILVHKDVDLLADNLIHNLHLDPAWHFTKLLVNGAAKINDAQLRTFATLAAVLAVIRIAEAYGLWHEKAWAEWFAVISAGIYVPLEVYRFWKDPKVGGAVVFLINVAIVVYLAKLLRERHRRKRAAMQQPAG